jgi:membrane associated rhomboid family serine protease
LQILKKITSFAIQNTSEYCILKFKVFIGQFKMHTSLSTHDVEALLQTSDPDLSWTWSFILTATQVPHHIQIKDDVFLLLVPAEHRSLALQQITDYFLENQDWPHKPHNPDLENNRIQPPTLLFVGALILFYSITGSWKSNSIWFQQGAGNSQAILEHHEWYRLITALTLHADVIHLLNNCILGGFLLHFFFLLTGTGLGLFALLITATIGNCINVVVHGPGHNFVGFSTAVFGVIGMLSMLSYKDRSRTIDSHVLLPLMAGVALLAMLGSEGERTDLGAHFFGLLCGLLMGKILCLPLIKKLQDSLFLQIVLFCVSLFIFSASWILAMQI